MADHPVLFRVLLFREPHDSQIWIAQALEYDIVAYGPDPEAAKRAFERTVAGYYEMAARRQEPPFATLKPAPDTFWRVWAAATAKREMVAEPIPSIPGHMIPAVTHESVSAGY